ncbi:MAG: hypothetical protein P0S96_01470 [Simkaniaceae bacterium]|nr:hypothetical protein [Candidatus Sacchlamyda saccharinae]
MRKTVLALLLLPTLLLARQKATVIHPGADVPYEPWFTGTLLAPTAVNMELGHPNVYAFLGGFAIYGHYDSSWKIHREPTTWAINPVFDIQFATSKRTGIEVVGAYIINYREGERTSHFQDTILLFGYQVSDDQKDSWVPDCRLTFRTLFPTGKFDQLNPVIEGIDATGQGAYFYGPGLACQKLFYLQESFFMLHWSFGYFYPTKTKIKNHNAYGGGFGTRGTIRPGQIFTAFLSGEYSWSQQWAFACDLQILHQTKTTDFNGEPGITPSGEVGTVGLSASTEIALAPAIEFSFTANTGFLFGAWFTLAGQNTEAFAALSLAYSHIF